MSKTMMILQAFGVGDAIFAQGVAKHFMGQGYEIIWPVRKQFLEGLKRAYPKVNWMPESIVKPELFDIKQDIEIDGVRIFPMRWGDAITGQPSKYWMKAKYDLAGLDYTKWKDGAMWARDHNQENELYNIYGLKPKEKFNLVNMLFGSEANRSISIKTNNGLKDVVMDIREGFSLFDYALLIERAETIHVANSSIFYLLELLDLSAKEVHLYCRKPVETDFRYVDYLFTKNYILHY